MQPVLFLKYVLRVFIPLAMLLVGSAYWILHDIKNDKINEITHEIHGQILVGKASANEKLHMVIRDALYLSESELLNKALDNPDFNSDLSSIAHDWMVLMASYQVYDQIRWIGPDGRERLRINQTKNGPQRIADEDLQDKSDRYYFSKAINLKPEQLYFSPLDLNKERGEIEFPRKPMIRLAKPVLDSQGANHGVLVLNYLADDLLRNIKQHEPEINHHLWLNNEMGYWLIGSTQKDEWGFMFNKPDLTIKDRYPEAWHKIFNQEQGVFSNQDGLWEFATIRPLREASLINLATMANIVVNDFPALDAAIESAEQHNPYFWKLIYFVPSKEVNTLVYSAQKPIYISLVALLTLLLIASLFWARMRMAKDVAVANLYESNQALEKTTRQLEKDVAAKMMSVERYSGVLNASMDGFVLISKYGEILECNQVFLKMMGLQGKEVEGCFFSDLFIGEHKDKVMQNFANIFEQKHSQFELEFINLEMGPKNKTTIEIRLSSVFSTQQICAFVRDVTSQKENEFKLKMAASVFTHANEGIILTNENFEIVDVNAEFSFITGYSRKEVIGQKPGMLRSGKHPTEFYQEIEQALRNKGHWYGEVWHRRKTGELFLEFLTITRVKHPHDNSLHYVGMFTDITLEKEFQKRLQHSAHFDALTHLPNRFLLNDRINQGMVGVKRSKTLLALVFIDLDGFKKINDEQGHDIGDSLLIHVSTKMKQVLRASDTIARIGGDEFVAVINELHNKDEVEPILHKILEAINTPLVKENKTLQVGGSLGVTFYPQDSDLDGEQLIRQADQAMYQAKQSGKNRFHFFNVQKDNDTRDLLKNIARLQNALYNNEFVLHYQPKVALRENQVIGVEALIRWQHPEKGLLYPGDFLHCIEKNDLAIKMSEWVILQALEQIEQWQNAGLSIPISINIGAKELQQENFIDWLDDLLKQHPNVNPKMLEIEVLETSALADVLRVSELIEKAKLKGVLFALDDFGTGFASLSYLKRLPIETIKIDRSFIRDMFDDSEDIALLEGLIGLTKSLHRHVIAEGIETEQHGSMLIELGCTYGQGFFIAKPMPGERVPDWIKHWKRPQSWVNQLSFAEQDIT